MGVVFAPDCVQDGDRMVFVVSLECLILNVEYYFYGKADVGAVCALEEG